MGKQVLSTLTSASMPGFGTSARPSMAIRSDVPGPGAYKIRPTVGEAPSIMFCNPLAPPFPFQTPSLQSLLKRQTGVRDDGAINCQLTIPWTVCPQKGTARGPDSAASGQLPLAAGDTESFLQKELDVPCLGTDYLAALELHYKFKCMVESPLHGNSLCSAALSYVHMVPTHVSVHGGMRSWRHRAGPKSSCQVVVLQCCPFASLWNLPKIRLKLALSPNCRGLLE